MSSSTIAHSGIMTTQRMLAAITPGHYEIPNHHRINLWSLIIVQSLSHVWLFEIPLTTAHQASLSFTIFQSLLKLMSIESVIAYNHLILCCPLLLLPTIFPIIKLISNESDLQIGWPKYWNFNISPSNEYSGLIPLELTGLLSLQSKGFSRVFSNTTVQKHQFFSTQLSLWSNSHIHTWLLEKS